MMKNLIYALFALVGVLIAVITVSMLLSSSLRELESRVEAYVFNEEPNYATIAHEFSMLREEFGERSSTLSLLVPDSALIEIEHSFGDVIGYAKAESYEGVITSVSRLRTSLEHLRELAGLNIKSVF